MLSPTVPWFAYTVILDEKTYTKVIKLVGFHWSITDLKQTDIDRPNLSIIKSYIKRRNKNNYKALFFIIKKAFREEVVEEDYISATLSKISIAPNRISAVPSKIFTAPNRISAAPSKISAVPSRISTAPNRISTASSGISISSSQVSTTSIY